MVRDEWRVIRFDSSVVAALSGTVLGFLKPLLDASTSLVPLPSSTFD